MQTLENSGHDALMVVISRPETELAPFETDGCSGGLSDAWKRAAGRFPEFAESHQSTPPWEDCCVTHDRAYHNAAAAPDAASSFDARLMADQTLQACVIATGEARADIVAETYDVTPENVTEAYDTIASAMFFAVRLGGMPCSGLPWRWGYGYPRCTVLTGAFD